MAPPVAVHRLATTRAGSALAASPTIVHVHGAWQGAHVWDAVVERLRHHQRSVLTVANPSASEDADTRGDLAADVAALQEVLDGVEGEKVVVAHCYGGRGDAGDGRA